MARTPTFTLSVGKLVNNTLATYLRNVVPFTVLAALVLLPWIVFRLYFGDDPNNPALPLGSMLLQGLLSYVLTGAVTYGAVQHLRGRPAPLGETISKGLQVFGRTLGTGIICGLRIFGFTLLLIVPGIMEIMRLFVAIPVAVIEGKDVATSIERSKALTDGSRWHIFGGGLLIYLIAFLLLGLATFVSVMFFSANVADARSSAVWIEILVALFANSFYATMMAVCYSMLREGKENVDPKQLAAVFD